MQPTNMAETNNDQEMPLLPQFQKLSTLLEEQPETLALGNLEIRATALDVAKHIFDLSVQSEVTSRPYVVDLISSLAPSQAPQTRSKVKTETQRMMGEVVRKDLFDLTPLKSLFVDDMDEEQIWGQLDLRTQTICRMLDYVLEGDTDSGEPAEESDVSSEDDGGRLRQALEALEEGEDIDMDEFMAKYGLGDHDELENSEDDDSQEDEIDDEFDDPMDRDAGEEEISPLRDPSSDEESDTEQPTIPFVKPSKKRKRGEASELDDGFFNLAEFNAYTEKAEARSSSRGRLAGDDSDDEDMNFDLFASIDDPADLDVAAENDSHELFYRDFFEPPARSSIHKSPKKIKGNQVRFHEEVRVRKIKPSGKNRSLHDDSEEDEGDEEDMFNGDDGEEVSSDEEGEQGWGNIDLADDDDDGEGSREVSDEENSNIDDNATIQRLKHDIFAEEEGGNDSNMTTHEKRMATLRDQIAELESENIAVKDWTLMGEAGTRQRPQNSLLEEDLEFDRVMKAVPIVTEEAVQTLEGTIKARILEGRFDDVVRIRPLEDRPFLPSKFFELQDKKSTQSLAQIYEDEYIASQVGGSQPDDRDGKLKKEHDEITLLWEKICGKLDALSNAHFVPKQPKATISTVTNAATATLESALPTSKSTTTMLAPEEVFSASPSSLRARSELTPTEKRALRSKERKHKKRQRDSLDKSVDKFAKKAKGIGGVKKQKQAALDSIVKHGKGVTVVGKKSAADEKRKKR